MTGLVQRLRVTVAGDDAGSAAVPVVVLVSALLLCIGLVVDGGAKVQALQRANAVAAEAARQSVQVLQETDRSGQLAAVDPSAAVAAGRSYLSAAGVPGSVQILTGQTVTVTTSITYVPVIMSLGGLGPQTVTGTAQVRLAQEAP